MAVLGNPLRIVIYGGIGSGKSTVAGLLRDRGAQIIEADKLGHAVLESDGAAFTAVSQRWPEVVDAEEINRSKLGAIVFADPEALAELEALTHPHIRAAIGAVINESVQEHLVLEVPILRDFVADDWVRVLIDVPLALRIDRAVSRGAERHDIESRAAAQPSDDEYHEAADWVVANTGDLEDLGTAVGELWAQLAAA